VPALVGSSAVAAAACVCQQTKSTSVLLCCCHAQCGEADSIVVRTGPSVALSVTTLTSSGSATLPAAVWSAWPQRDGSSGQNMCWQECNWADIIAVGLPSGLGQNMCWRGQLQLGSVVPLKFICFADLVKAITKTASQVSGADKEL